jgi:hypothetical protein
MDYSWQGSDNRKLSMLKDLYRKELDNNKELTSMSLGDKPTIHVCNSVPPQDTIFWYIQNKSSASTSEIVEHYFKIKEYLNIKNILIKDASYSSIYGYLHILLNQYNKVIYLRNEHEIDDYMIHLLVEEKVDASS